MLHTRRFGRGPKFRARFSNDFSNLFIKQEVARESNLMRVFSAVAAVALMALASLPTVSSQASSPYEQTDPAGDVMLMGPGGAPLGPAPSSPVSAYLDVVKVGINESGVENILIQLTTTGGFRRFEDGGFVSGFTRTIHGVVFQIPRSSTFARIDVLSYLADGETEPRVVTVYLCYVQTPDIRGCPFTFLWGLRFQVVEGALEIELPKQLLTTQSRTGVYGPQVTLPERLHAGEALTRLLAYGTSYPSGLEAPETRPVSLLDRVPNEGNLPPYELQNGSATHDLRLAMPQNAVIGGQESILRLEIRNLAGNKRLVNLTAQVTSTPSTGWTFSMPPTVTVPGGASVNATVRVTAPASAENAVPTALVRVRGSVLTEPDTVALGTFFVQAVPPLDAAHSTFYVHHPKTFPFRIGGVPIPQEVFGWYAGFNSRIEADPRADDTRMVYASQFGVSGFTSGYQGFFVRSRETVPNAALVRAGEPAKVHLVIDSTLPMSTTVRFTLSTSDRMIAQGEQAATLNSGKNVLEFDAPVAPDVRRLGPQDAPALFYVRIDHPLPAFFAPLIPGQRLGLVPRESWVRLPLDREQEAVVDPNLPKVALQGQEELESFVNPGRRAVFEFLVENQEQRRLALQLEAEGVRDPWTVGLAPAARISVPANGSARVGVVVDAPETAKEGEALEFQLVTRLVEDGRLVASAKIRVIATRGLDIENETFQASSEDAAPLDVDADGRSPAAPALVAFAVVAAFLLVGRRRRRG